jgi:hypothetical protein
MGKSEENRIENPGRLSRRLFMFKSLAGAATVAMGTAVVTTVATVQPAEAQSCTDRDPSDGAGRGRWCRRRRGTDSDPNDAPGRGRRRRSCTDSDPRDGAGRGRRC